MTERDDLPTIVNLITAVFPNFHEPAGFREAYYLFLRDIPVDELRAAVTECIADPNRKPFPPSIGEIRGAVMELRRKAMNVPSAIEAWGEVQHLMITVTHYSTPHFSNEMIANLVGRFGWNNLCLSENMVADRAHFIKAYDLAVEEAMKSDLRLPAVQKYIETQQPRRLEVKAGVKVLAETLGKR